MADQPILVQSAGMRIDRPYTAAQRMSINPQVANGEPFTWSVRVYYEDTDTGGIVYYANYLKFFERCRTEWLRAAGFEQRRLSDEFGLQFVVARVDCEYRQPARLDDLLQIDLRVAKAGRVFIVFEQTARRAEVVRRDRPREGRMHRLEPLCSRADAACAG